MWFKFIQLELDLFEGQVIEPKKEVDEETEQVVGTLGRDLQVLYTLQLTSRKEAEALKLEAFNCSKSEEEDLKVRYYRAWTIGELLGELFWLEVREAFNLWEDRMVGVRRGFKVVTSEAEESSNPLADFLGRFMDE